MCIIPSRVHRYNAGLVKAKADPEQGTDSIDSASVTSLVASSRCSRVFAMSIYLDCFSFQGHNTEEAKEWVDATMKT